MKNIDSYDCEINLLVDDIYYKYFDLETVAKKLKVDLKKVPISLKVILENLLRNEDGETINKSLISQAFTSVTGNQLNDDKSLEISFFFPKFDLISEYSFFNNSINGLHLFFEIRLVDTDTALEASVT